MNSERLPLLKNLVLAPLVFMGFSSTAHADYLYSAGVGSWEFRPQKEGILSIEPRFLLLNSNTNFDPAGTALAVSNLNSWSRIQGETAVRYGLSDRVSLLGKISWSLVQSDHTTTTYSGTAFGFGDQTVGLSYRAYQSRGTSLRPHENLRIDFVLLGDIPAYANPIAAANQPPFLGNGSFDLTFSPLMTWTFSGTETEATQLVGSFGYTFRSGGYSMHLPWSVGIRREVTNHSGFQFSALARGTVSLRNDARTLVGEGEANGAGGSAAINAINPMMVEGQVQAGFRLAPTFAIAGFGHFPLYGQNIPAGLRLGAQLSIDFGHAQRKRPDQLSNKDYERGNQGFVTYGLEAKVLRANDRLNLVKIDKGTNDGVEQGQLFDIFQILQNGKTGEAIARAQVTAVRAQESALSVTEYFREVLIDEGFVARLAMP